MSKSYFDENEFGLVEGSGIEEQAAPPPAPDPMEPYLKGETIVSRTGTRHLVGRREKYHHHGRVSTWCWFGIRADEALTAADAVRDCQFCLDEVKQVKRRIERKAAGLADTAAQKGADHESAVILFPGTTAS